MNESTKVDQHKKVDPTTLKIFGCNGEWIQATSLERAMWIYTNETGDDDFVADDWEERPLDGHEAFFLEDVTPEEMAGNERYYVPDGGEVTIKDRRVYVEATRRQWLEFDPREKYFFSENF